MEFKLNAGYVGDRRLCRDMDYDVAYLMPVSAIDHLFIHCNRQSVQLLAVWQNRCKTFRVRQYTQLSQRMTAMLLYGRLLYSGVRHGRPDSALNNNR